ncbi:hypothetical protein [Polyangium sp. 6x1]|uniref:hypothetical protein n=1 Tax=Polyangium sp. 6x1 TaxID=3042689 RepID=UPI0024823145|nr:hypothetical protein [Polyangium sp. 6x1]MDI1442526.1 hypothetical protein [Polyangium sp. 6x1]
MRIKRVGVAVCAIAALVGCSAGGDGRGGDGDGGEGGSWGGAGGAGGGGSALFDLDTANGLWLTTQSGKAMILFTYKGSATVLMDVRATPHGATEGQYSGSRLGTVASGYTLQLDCLNPGSSPVCDAFGATMELSCTSVAGPELVCGSLVFAKVTSADISQ